MKKLKINLGIAPIAWSNDDVPELGGDTPIEECLEEAKEAGKLTKKGKEEVQEKVGPLKNYFKDLWENFSDGYNE